MVEPDLGAVRIACQRGRQHFRAEPAGGRIPRRSGRVDGLSGGLFALELAGLLVRKAVARQAHALGRGAVGEAGDVVARSLPVRRERAGIQHQAAFDVEVAYQRVQHGDGVSSVEPRAAHRAAMRVGHGALAIAGEALGQGRDLGGGHAAQFRVLVQRLAARLLAQQRQRTAHAQRLGRAVHARRGHRVIHEQRGGRGGGVRRQRAIFQTHYIHVFPLVAGICRTRPTQVRTAQETAQARMAGLGHHQMGRVGPGGLARRLHGVGAGLRQRAGVVAFVVQDPADQPHGQAQVASRVDGHPLVARSGRQAGRSRQHGRHHHIGKAGLFGPHAGLGQLPGLALERVAGLRRRRPDEQAEARIVPIGFAVGHALQVAQRGARAHAETLAAIGAVVAEVDRAKGLAGKALDERRTPFVGRVREEKLVDLGAVLGILRIQRRLAVEDGAQAVHMAFAEQVAAFADFLHQLFERDGLPLALAALAHPL